MTQVRPRVSYADLERLPEDGRRYELYDGELFEMPAPIPRHQRVIINVMEALRDCERAAGGLVLVSPVDVVLTEYDVVQPDVVMFAADRAPLVDLSKPLRVPPDLAVEVLSPSTLRNDRGRKMDLLARHGVREYWLIDPVQNTLERYVLDDGVYRLDAVGREADTIESAVLPGFSAPGSRVFAA
jgi:Uma2 family endonuclease